MSLRSKDRLEFLARLGYSARGLVSVLIGVLALIAAFGGGGGATGSKGALRTLLEQPLGHVILGVTAFGLFCFAAWRACQAVLDADGRGRKTRALLARGGQFISAIAYCSLSIFAIGLMIGLRPGSDDEQAPRDWTAWLMSQPFGRWLVAAVGLVIIGAAIAMAAKATTASFRRHLACDARAARWVVPLGRAGFAARAAVFLTIGGFLLVAAWQFDPNEARGLGGALVALREQPFGRALYILVAIGLAAFGAFQFAEARYRRIDAPDGDDVMDAARAPLR